MVRRMATPAPEAPTPRRPTWRAVLRALRLAGRHWADDECDKRAAAIAYYGLLSFFPFIILLASMASLVVGDDAADIQRALSPLRPMLPQLGAAFWDRVQDLVERRGLLSVFSLVVLVLLATRVTVAIESSLAAIFHARAGRDRPRRTWLLSLWSHFMTLAVLVVLGLTLTSVALMELLLRLSGSPRWVREAVESSMVTRHAIPFVLLVLVCYALFGRVPGMVVQRRWRIAGGVFFALTHDAVVSLLARLTGALSARDIVYGSFVGVVSFAAWGWVAASLLLYSAEAVAQLNGDRGPG